MIPCEKYSLILKHEYVDTNGKTHLLNGPLGVYGITNLFDETATFSSANEIIHNLFEQMEYEVMQEYGEI